MADFDFFKDTKRTIPFISAGGGLNKTAGTPSAQTIDFLRNLQTTQGQAQPALQTTPSFKQPVNPITDLKDQLAGGLIKDQMTSPFKAIQEQAEPTQTVTGDQLRAIGETTQNILRSPTTNVVQGQVATAQSQDVPQINPRIKQPKPTSTIQESEQQETEPTTVDQLQVPQVGTEELEVAGQRAEEVIGDAKDMLQEVETEVTQDQIDRISSLRGNEAETQAAMQDVEAARNVLRGLAEGDPAAFGPILQLLDRVDASNATTARALAQQISTNPNLTEGAKLAAQAINQRQASIQKSVLAGDISRQVQAQMLNAADRLGALGLQTANFYEAQHQADMSAAFNEIRTNVDVAVANGQLSIQEAALIHDNALAIHKTNVENANRQFERDKFLVDDENQKAIIQLNQDQFNAKERDNARADIVDRAMTIMASPNYSGNPDDILADPIYRQNVGRLLESMGYTPGTDEYDNDFDLIAQSFLDTTTTRAQQTVADMENNFYQAAVAGGFQGSKEDYFNSEEGQRLRSVMGDFSNMVLNGVIPQFDEDGTTRFVDEVGETFITSKPIIDEQTGEIIDYEVTVTKPVKSITNADGESIGEELTEDIANLTETLTNLNIQDPEFTKLVIDRPELASMTNNIIGDDIKPVTTNEEGWDLYVANYGDQFVEKVRVPYSELKTMADAGDADAQGMITYIDSDDFLQRVNENVIPDIQETQAGKVQSDLDQIKSDFKAIEDGGDETKILANSPLAQHYIDSGVLSEDNLPSKRVQQGFDAYKKGIHDKDEMATTLREYGTYEDWLENRDKFDLYYDIDENSEIYKGMIENADRVYDRDISADPTKFYGGAYGYRLDSKGKGTYDDFHKYVGSNEFRIGETFIFNQDSALTDYPELRGKPLVLTGARTRSGESETDAGHNTKITEYFFVDPRSGDKYYLRAGTVNSRMSGQTALQLM